MRLGWQAPGSEQDRLTCREQQVRERRGSKHRAHERIIEHTSDWTNAKCTSDEQSVAIEMSRVLPLKWWFVNKGSCSRIRSGVMLGKKRDGDTEFDQLAATPNPCCATR